MNSTAKVLSVILKPKRDKAVRAFHPWIFSGAIDQIDQALSKGDLVHVYSREAQFLGVGYFNPKSQIAVRLLTFKDEEINLSFFIRKCEAAKRLRDLLIGSDTNAYRCIYSEGDFLPGLVVDRYADFLVVQFLTAGMEALKTTVVRALEHVFRPKGIFEKGDSEARRHEGLETTHQVLSGEAPPDRVKILEFGVPFLVDLKKGQKTGFFFDQRENRKRILAHVKGKRVLDAFAYTGAFSIHAAKSGASSVTAVEKQKLPLELLKQNFDLNGLKEDSYRLVRADVFDFLRNNTDIYDVVVLDPPAFCRGKQQIQQAARGYKDVNLNALKRLSPGGILFTSSCSYFIDADLFQKIVFGAAKDAGREVQIIDQSRHALDHPVSLYHPEGSYLKSLFLRVL